MASSDEAVVGLIGMSERSGRRKRRSFRWPEEATQLVREYLRSSKPGQFRSRNSVAGLATRLAALSGNPRDACFRFLHHEGVTQRRTWRPWTKPEQQRLFDLILHIGITAADLLRLLDALRSVARREHGRGSESQPKVGTDDVIVDRLLIAYPPGVPLAVPGEAWNEQLRQRVEAGHRGGANIYTLPAGHQRRHDLPARGAVS